LVWACRAVIGTTTDSAKYLQIISSTLHQIFLVDDFLTFFTNLQSKKYAEKVAEFLLSTRIVTVLKPFKP